ncbi:MFS transporter [Mucilaginibacter flavidus]|uniref:MFS transporter n=1 Tax=Mucilaginibacter flavidus TaxID=2949309 RepID=UPI002092F66C|nr:MFS transporter [Mucilaginibacter flavidus]MCO5949355.1 MFS transporter [Mucilaginibacter flavidus]
MAANFQFISNSKPTLLQLTTVSICFLMNMLDGTNVMIISYTAPAIAKEWTINPQLMGFVFSAGLLGMAIGAMFLAPYADKIGRYAMVLISVVLMGATIFSTAYVQNAVQLILLRILSGFGIGAMLASTATLTSEYAPPKLKTLWVSLVMGGYPIGAVLSGLVVASFLPAYGWRLVFELAGVATLITIPLIIFFLGESLDFLFKTQPLNALKRINLLMKKMRMPLLAELPVLTADDKQKNTVSSLMVPQLKWATLKLWLGIFMCFATLYFLTSWIPKLAAITGMSVSLAIYAGTIFNLGAFAGIVTQGFLSAKFGLLKTITSFLFFTALLMISFSFFSRPAGILIMIGLIGFGIQGGFVGLYSLAADLYPTKIRATGVGWAIGLGRAGAIIGPIAGGTLITAGMHMSATFTVFSVPLLVGAAATWFNSTTEKG